MVNLALATALAAAAPQAPPAETVAQPAEPAMFVVRDTDTTVYIFGTFHALDGKGDWFRDEVKAAFDGSRTVTALARRQTRSAGIGRTVNRATTNAVNGL